MELKTEDKLVIALIDEFNKVHENASKLNKFISGEKPDVVSDEEWMILFDQFDAMIDYRNCILERIAIHTLKDKDISMEEKVKISAASLGALEE